MSRSGQCGQHGQEQRWCRHGGRADALKGAVMWHLGRAGGAAGPGGWGGGARSRGLWSRVTTSLARHWRRDAGEEEERQIKANLPPTPSGAPPPPERDSPSWGRLWGADHQTPSDLA